MTYRDVDVQPRLTEIVQGLQNRAFFWSVKLGPIEKESADCLISEALVGRILFHANASLFDTLFLITILVSPVHASDLN